MAVAGLGSVPHAHTFRLAAKPLMNDRHPSPPLCVVTGASSGIGLAVARRLLDEGWRVTGIDRQPAALALRPGYRHLTCDLAASQDLTDLCDGALADVSATALVHCAGLVRSGGATDTRNEDAELLWRLHELAPMALVRALAPRMPAQRGRIVLVSSRAVLGRAHRVAYAATKAAQIGMARSLAAELIASGITVNVVAPGAVDTPMLRDPSRGAPPNLSLPMGRLISADEAANAVTFFLGEQAGAITGQTLYVCGGASLGSMT